MIRTLRLVLGMVAGLPTVSAHLEAQDLLQSWTGEKYWYSRYNYFGEEVGTIGDVNGDGIPDAIVGAPEAFFTNQIGEAWVKSGADGSDLLVLAGPSVGSYFSRVVGTGGDLDGDGVGDYLIATLDVVMPKAVVYAYSGASGSLLYSLTSLRRSDGFGGALSMLNDVDGDGSSDFILGADAFDYHDKLSQSGRAYVYSGKTGIQLYTIDGTVAFEYLGSSVCAIDDLDGDGLREVGVGATGWMAGSAGQGTFSIYSGATGTPLVYLEGESTNDFFGEDSCALGDVDRDGTGDFAVSSAHSSAYINNGRVYVYSGATSALLYSYDGSAYNEVFGLLPRDGRIDFNSDGYADIAIGDPAYSVSGAAGATFVYSGRNGRVLYSFFGSWANSIGEGLGGSLTVAGDNDRDGIDDLIVGAPGNSSDQPTAGRVYIYAGNDLFLQANQTSYLPGDTLTLDVRGGEPYVADLLVATGVNGIPIFVPVALGTLDQFGEWELSGTVPSGLSGLTLTFTAYAQRAPIGVVDSSPQTLTFN